MHLYSSNTRFQIKAKQSQKCTPKQNYELIEQQVNKIQRAITGSCNKTLVTQTNVSQNNVI